MIISKKTPKEIVLSLGNDCDKGKHCDGSHHCCSFSTGFLAETDLKKIADFLKISEDELKSKYLKEVRMFNKNVLKPKSLENKGKPYGPCIFLDPEQGCKIHKVKPLHCKLYTCKPYGFDLTQWFYLTYLVDPNDPASIREYAEFLKFNEPIPGGSLEELVPDKEKLAKMLSYEIFREEK